MNATVEGRLVPDKQSLEKPGDFCWQFESVLMFLCPACGENHFLGVISARHNGGWKWNGDKEKPTLVPSIYFASGHQHNGHDNGCRWHGYLTEGTWKGV